MPYHATQMIISFVLLTTSPLSQISVLSPALTEHKDADILHSAYE